MWIFSYGMFDLKSSRLNRCPPVFHFPKTNPFLPALCGGYGSRFQRQQNFWTKTKDYSTLLQLGSYFCIFVRYATISLLISRAEFKNVYLYGTPMCLCGTLPSIDTWEGKPVGSSVRRKRGGEISRGAVVTFDSSGWRRCLLSEEQVPLFCWSTGGSIAPTKAEKKKQTFRLLRNIGFANDWWCKRKHFVRAQGFPRCVSVRNAECNQTDKAPDRQE